MCDEVCFDEMCCDLGELLCLHVVMSPVADVVLVALMVMCDHGGYRCEIRASVIECGCGFTSRLTNPSAFASFICSVAPQPGQSRLWIVMKQTTFAAE